MSDIRRITRSLPKRQESGRDIAYEESLDSFLVPEPSTLAHPPIDPAVGEQTVLDLSQAMRKRAQLRLSDAVPADIIPARQFRTYENHASTPTTTLANDDSPADQDEPVEHSHNPYLVYTLQFLAYALPLGFLPLSFSLAARAW